MIVIQTISNSLLINTLLTGIMFETTTLSKAEKGKAFHFRKY
jgi:hypothetical protein